MKIGIIGSGAIGFSIATTLKESGKDFEVTLIGDKSNFGASRSAGAMLNILSEVDWFNAENNLMEWKLRNRRSCLEAWKDKVNYLSKSLKSDKSLIFGKGTDIRLLKQQATEIETKSFEAMKRSANKHNIDIEKIETEKYIGFTIPDEKSVDSHEYLKLCEELLVRNNEMIYGTVDKITKDDAGISVAVGDKILTFDKLVIAAGAWSDSLIKQAEGIEKPNLSCYNDAGSALLIKSEFPHIKSPEIDRIIRTPNRGGTCGIHAVQRKETIYIGASSHPTQIKIKESKIQSIEALIKGIEEVVEVKTEQLSMKPLLGYRPVTEDTYPIIGKLSENVWCIYGTKRDGFTWANYYAKNISNELLEGSNSEKSWQEMLRHTEPCRYFTSYASPINCIEAYIENKKSEAIQHGEALTSKDCDNLRKLATEFHMKIAQKLKKDIGVHPDLVNLLKHMYDL